MDAAPEPDTADSEDGDNMGSAGDKGLVIQFLPKLQIIHLIPLRQYKYFEAYTTYSKSSYIEAGYIHVSSSSQNMPSKSRLTADLKAIFVFPILVIGLGIQLTKIYIKIHRQERHDEATKRR